MRLKVSHDTIYRFETPAQSGLYQLRLTPQSQFGQTVEAWTLMLEGGRVEAEFVDQHNNWVTLASLEAGGREIAVRASGDVLTQDRAGMIGPHEGCAPLWLFARQTRITQAGAQLEALIGPYRDIPAEGGDIARLHALAAAIAMRVRYDTSGTDVATTAEEALVTGRGVCQDHTHIFLSAARALGYPARYVSGYLLMNDRTDQDAGHAWAEAHVPGLGWVGFDVSNGISPDDRYVRVATGLDYSEAAPIYGIILGGVESALSVTLQVQQQ